MSSEECWYADYDRMSFCKGDKSITFLQIQLMEMTFLERNVIHTRHFTNSAFQQMLDTLYARQQAENIPMKSDRSSKLTDEYVPDKRDWDEFREAGLLWWVNRILHLFGWAIVMQINDTTGKIDNVYPARAKYHGCCEHIETTGFQQLSKYLQDNINEIEKETHG